MWVFDGEDWESDATERDLSRRKETGLRMPDRFKPELQPELQIVEIVPVRPVIAPSLPLNRAVPEPHTH